MAKYKITAIDEAKKHCTYEVWVDGKKADTQTRGDLTLSDKETLHAELSDYAISIERSLREVPAVDPEVKKMEGKSLDAEDKETRANKPKEVKEDNKDLGVL